MSHLNDCLHMFTNIHDTCKRNASVARFCTPRIQNFCSYKLFYRSKVFEVPKYNTVGHMLPSQVNIKSIFMYKINRSFLDAISP